MFDDPAHGLVVVAGAASADQRPDSTLSQVIPVEVVVIAAVGNQNLGLAARSPRPAAYRWDGPDQREKLGDVVAIAAGEDRGQRQAAAVADQVVLRPDLAAVDRARLSRGAPFFACTWEESATARDQSI